ncbi:MAG: hypothetical protein K8R36_22005 [Planctomycetales bacterium]|nr:hypothetical protein [Planctomycetales bacterium]
MHTIRLRGPWELYLPGSEQPLRIEMPATWETLHALCSAAAPLPSPARLVRRFGKPTGLSSQDRLHLVIDSSSADFQLELNGEQLGNIPISQGSRSFEVTALLNPRNELVILLQISPREVGPPAGSTLLRDVRLEIEAAAE